jgi:hypothetical protein
MLHTEDATIAAMDAAEKPITTLRREMAGVKLTNSKGDR